MSETTTCYREPTNGVYFTRNAHRTDCVDPECRGCRLCPERRHCTAARNCTWHVAEGELTCGRCLGKARTDLRWIPDLASLLLPAALEARLGSEAANLAGPSADPYAWSWHKVALLRSGVDVDRIEDDDEHNPHRVVETWARMLTEDYGHPMPRRASLTWCVDYLDRNLHRVANDDEQDFPLLAAELRKCRQHIEATLSTAQRKQHGAPCPDCPPGDRATQTPPPPRLVRQFGHWCPDEACERIHYSTRFDADAAEDVPDTTGDMWVCPRDRKHAWTHEAYSKWIDERRGGRSA